MQSTDDRRGMADENETFTANEDNSENSNGGIDPWKIAKMVIDGAMIIAPLVFAAAPSSGFAARMQAIMGRIAPGGVHTLLRETGTGGCEPDVDIVDVRNTDEGLCSSSSSRKESSKESQTTSFGVELRVKYERNTTT